MSFVLKTVLTALHSSSPDYNDDYNLIDEYFETHEFQGVFPEPLLGKLRQLHRSDDETTSLVETLKPLTKIASSYAFCKPSGFPVGGACYCSESKTAYIGFNMEASKHWIGYSVHGEQCTFNNALIHGETKIDLLVISYTPCGHCRQFINQFEFRNDLIIHIITLEKSFHIHDLLPYDFNPNDLPSISFPDVNSFHIVQEDGDEADSNLVDIVIDSAKKSHLDNLINYCAVGLVVDDEVIVGNFIENCAHNPSFHPINGAISQLALRGKRVEQATNMITVQHKDSPFYMDETSLGIAKAYGYTSNKQHRVILG
ncbi:Cytidine deaminase [Entamoeba marina]